MKRTNKSETLVASTFAEYTAIMAARETRRISAFERDSKTFPVGTKVTTSWGQGGVVVAEKGRVGLGVTTIRVQYGNGQIGRFAPSALRAR